MPIEASSEATNLSGRPGGEQQSAAAANGAEHQGLDQQAAEQADAAGADGDAHGNLTAAADSRESAPGRRG